jgi:uncharacterized membrane protein YgcG
MTNNLYDSLEICLQALEEGADGASLESCLARFPALADELRPILETAIQARAQAVREVPADAMRRGRARVLQHAAELRERERAAALAPFWRKFRQSGRAVRTLATSLAVLVFLFSGGTGLVFASSDALPGDNLYPVKRSWEGVQLALILDPKAKSQRETEFEQERVHEIHTLFSESRKTKVDFQGVVESQQPNVWQVAGLKIAIDNEATFNGKIVPGALVRVIGETEDGIIQAEQISLIQVPSVTPTLIPTATLQPTQPPSDNATETKEPGQIVEPGKTEQPDIETPEPKQTDSRESQPTEKPNDGGGDGGGGDGGGGDGGGDGGGSGGGH